MRTERFFLPDENATFTLATQFAKLLIGGVVLYLEGDLGVGKTTFCQGLLRAFGYEGAVKSPTYTLVESYEFADKRVYHFDLYRLAAPEELEYIGIRDYFEESALCLIEWPQKGKGILPKSDLTLFFCYFNLGRIVTIQSDSAHGDALLQQIESLSLLEAIKEPLSL